MIVAPFIFGLLTILGLIVWYSWWYGITPTPTSPKVKRKLLEMSPSQLDGTIVELGSGWGTLAFALARRYPACQIEAYEISPIPYLFSKIVAQIGGYSNLTIMRRDFFTISLSHANLIFCYLYPGAMTRLQTKFENELPSGSFILSHTFALPGWKPIRIDFVDYLYQTPVYLYQKLS